MNVSNNSREYYQTTGFNLWKIEMRRACGIFLECSIYATRILNSCTVKDPSEMVFRNHVTEAKEKGKMVVVAGCVPQGAILSVYLNCS